METAEKIKVNVRIILAFLWVSHFLLWTFGDMLSLLQKLGEPVDNNLLLFAAVPLAITQVSMILYTLIGKQNIMRWVTIGITSIFIVFNIGFIAEAQFGWEYLLGFAYILLNILIIRSAWKWSASE